MIGKKAASLFVALCLFSAFGLAAEKTIESLWTPLPVKIDGIAQDWDDTAPIVEEKTEVEYALKNDGQNLYLIMVFKKPNILSTLEFTGMKIYFTTAGKKSKNLGVEFKKKQLTPDELIASLEEQGETLTEEKKAEIRKQKAYASFTAEPINKKNVASPSDPAVQTEYPTFRAGAVGRIAVYEFRIPLSRVNQPGGIGVEPGQPVMLGFEWGGMTAQIMRDLMASQADRSVAAADRGVSSERGWKDESGDGGGGGGGMGGGEFRRDPRYLKKEFWITAKLAGPGQ
jgi:hypothetical protein